MKGEKCTNFSEYLKERDHLEDLDVNEKMMLKFISKKRGSRE
jgi:hypothetical protein